MMQSKIGSKFESQQGDYGNNELHGSRRGSIMQDMISGDVMHHSGEDMASGMGSGYASPHRTPRPTGRTLIAPGGRNPNLVVGASSMHARPSPSSYPLSPPIPQPPFPDRGGDHQWMAYDQATEADDQSTEADD
jgi:hypothetical protein